jgi:cell division transport system ATP-binding protein
VIQIHRLTMRFPSGIEALRDVSFRVHEGELVFLAGRSGSGKSTLLSLIAAELKPVDGQILVLGRNLAVMKREQRPFLRRAIGRLWQEPRLLATRSIEDNVMIPLEILGAAGDQARRRVAQVLELVGMERHAKALPSWLSGLEQQRVALARAIVHEPSLVLADEPTGNLDVEGALAILQMLRDLRSRGTTIVIATRDRTLTQRFEERVIVLNKGFLIEDDSALTAAPAGEAGA